MNKRLIIGIPTVLILSFISFVYFYHLDCSACSGDGTEYTSVACSSCRGKGEVDCDYKFTSTRNQGGLDKFFDNLWGISSEPERFDYKCKGGRYWSSTSYAPFQGDICSACNGDGKTECEDCEGYGRISSTRDCYKCDGKGRYTLFELWLD